MRNLLFTLFFVAAVCSLRADTFTLTDGASFTGDVVKPDDNGLMVHTSTDTFTNLAWGRLSQDTLKQLLGNPKLKAYAEPFIEPDPAQRPPKQEITVNAVQRLTIPAAPSVLGGLFTSSLGWFMLLVVYVANLVAAYEIAIVKARAKGQVIGVAAVLPIIGPDIFLILPMYTGPSADEKSAEAAAAEVAAAQAAQKIQITDASWKKEEAAAAQAGGQKKVEAQVFPRGKFTFNKRFVETKFAAYLGNADSGQAREFAMEVKTSKESFQVTRIAEAAATELILATADRGQVSVPYTDIQEVKLNPRNA